MKSGLICIFAGIIFFFNPNFNMFDILPDFLGCMLIAFGLSNMSKIDENLESARKCAVYCGWISVVKLPLSVWANIAHKDYLLPLAFIFAVLEIIFLLSLFNNLYTGLGYIGTRHGFDVLNASCSNARSMTAIFVVVTRVLDFAPQIISLMQQDEELDLSYNAYRKIPLNAVKPYITAACMLVCLILGILLIAMTAAFFIKAAKNKEFVNVLNQKYQTDVLTDKERYASMVLPSVYVLIFAGLFFIFDFSLDAVNILPTFVSPVLFIRAFTRLKRLDSSLKAPFVWGLICIAFSAANYFYMTKVNLGINYLFGTESLNLKEFELLQSPQSVAVSAVLGAVQCISLVALLFSLYGGMKKVFSDNMRTNAIGLLTLCKINAVLLSLLGFAYSLLRVVSGHLATNSNVNSYVVNRVLITNESQLAEALHDPLVSAFDKCDTAAVIVSAVFFIAMLWNILYLSKVSLASEGEKQR